MTANTGTLIPAKIVPHDSADTYATHSEEWGQGGYRTCATTTDRDAIPAARLKEGMLVYVTATGFVYQLAADLTTWNIFSAAGGGSGSVTDPIEAELRYISRQYANLIMTNAELSALQSRRGNYFADGFEVATYIRTGGSPSLVSANYARATTDSDSDGLNDWVIQPSKTTAPTLITPSSTFGNMTDGGGVAKAFDGVKTGGGASGSTNTARYSQTNSGLQYAFIGQDCGSAKSINKVVITPDLVGGFEVTGGAGSLTFNLWGSNIAPNVNGGAADGISLVTSPVTITVDKLTAVTLTAKTGLSSYRYVWVTISTTNGLVRTYAVAEVEFYQNAGSTNNMTLYGGLTATTPFKVAAAPAYWRMWVDMQLTDVAFDLAADFTAYASRNGGTNFQLLPLVDQIGDTSGPLRLYRSDWVDCSAGHAAGSPPTLATKFVSANNHQFNFRRYLFEWRYS